MDTLHDEGGLANRVEVGEALAARLLPVAKCRQLRLGDVRPRRWLAVVLALHQPPDEGGAGGLAGGRGSEEDLLQDGISAIRRVVEMPGQTRLLDVHDVLAAARGGPDEDHP